MKRQVHLKRIFLNNNYFSRKGQALVELATFGTILLFCLAMLVNFGLQANYQQEIEMKAFRQAMQQAYNNNDKGPSAGAEVNLIEDKPGVTVQDPYGISERYPFGANAKATWNNNLMDEYVDKSDNFNYAYLPNTSYEINGQGYSYNIADFCWYPCNGFIRVRVADRLDEDKDGVFWRDVYVNCATQTKVFIDESSEGKPKVGYVKIDREKQQINSADVDGDGKQELVVKVEGDEKGPIMAFWVLDSQAGRIDTTVEMPHKSDGTNDLEEYARRRQGLLPGYSKTVIKSGTFNKVENNAGITTTTSATSTETITRTIKDNYGINIPAESRLPYEKNITWTTPK